MPPIRANGMKVLMNDLKNTYPFWIGFGFVGIVLAGVQANFTEEDRKQSKYANPKLAQGH